MLIQISQGKLTAPENGQKIEQIQETDNGALGDRNEHKTFPQRLRKKKIVFDDVVITDVTGQIHDHEQQRQCIAQHGADQIFDGRSLVWLIKKKEHQKDN